MTELDFRGGVEVALFAGALFLGLPATILISSALVG